MSTYNGEKYLHEQIDSVLEQKEVNARLIVRDDGSTDNTINILNEYRDKGLLQYYTGENLGPQRSFMHLLQHAPESDYYAFADQDDVWLPEKLSIAIQSIKDANKPALYYSQTQLTDAELDTIPSVIIHPKNTFGESLIYKFIGGCTMVMNHRLRLAIGEFMPDEMPMHDIWIYSIALGIDAFVVFDPTPHILYRQHRDNTVGLGQGFIYEWKKRFVRFFTQKNERFLQAKELSIGYSNDITPKNAALLQLFLDGKTSAIKRISIILNKDLRCSDKITQILFWINVIFNKY